jgi:hypothetical protein
MSIISRIARDEVVREPFPHVVVRNVLDEALCSRLVAEFPPIDVVTQGRRRGNNKRFSYAASKAMADERVSDLWKQTIRQHVSQSFLDELLYLFHDHILNLYPDFERRYGRLASLRAGVRGVDDRRQADVLLDALTCVNTPVVGKPTSVRGPHVDRLNKLFTALFYLRADEDDSQGGDLQLCRLKDRENICFKGRFMSDADVEPVTTVNYERNTLVLFLNSWESIHSVTKRSMTTHARAFLVLIGELREPLFTLPRRWSRRWKRWMDWSIGL